MSEQVSDPFKRFSQILEPDVRAGFMSVRDAATGMRQATLEDHHNEIAHISLNESAPVEVRQLFETAKNLALYTWFVWRFHQPAQLYAYGAVELALREKAKNENPDWWNKEAKKFPPPLKKLLDEAKNCGWIKNEEFSRWRHHQQLAAWQIADYKQLDEMIRLNIKEAESPRFEDFEGEIGDPGYDYVAILTTTIPYSRNNLAHGNSKVGPNSIGTLEICAELINALFKA